MQDVTRRTVLISGIGAVGGLALGAGPATAQQASKPTPAFDASHNPNLEKIAPQPLAMG